MEDRIDSTMAVKVEKHSQYIILTYFHGDINSMVDAHFNRALSNICKDKAPAAKTKKTHKTIKLGKFQKPSGPPFQQITTNTSSVSPTEKSSSCQGSAVGTYSGSQVPSLDRLLTLSPADDAPDSWQSFPVRAGEGPGLPSITYSLSPEGLSLTGQQYASSLLNLLHNDQGEMGSSMAHSSKTELPHNWMPQQGFRESVDPSLGFEPGKPSIVIYHQVSSNKCFHLSVLRKVYFFLVSRVAGKTNICVIVLSKRANTDLGTDISGSAKSDGKCGTTSSNYMNNPLTRGVLCL